MQLGWVQNGTIVYSDSIFVAWFRIRFQVGTSSMVSISKNNYIENSEANSGYSSSKTTLLKISESILVTVPVMVLDSNSIYLINYLFLLELDKS